MAATTISTCPGLGNQNNELPADVEVGDWASVVIWCDRFNSAFGAADLAAA